MMRQKIENGELMADNGNLQRSKAFDPKKGIVFWIIAGVLGVLWSIGRYSAVGGNWIHWLFVLAVLATAFGVHRGLRGSLNIDAERTDIPKWDSANPTGSLLEIHSYVIGEAVKSTDWYWKHKGAKAFFSQAVRFFAWILAAIGGLLPIAGILFKDQFRNYKFDNPLWASLLLGGAAALLGLDKTFGYSSGWARYVLTATNIRKSLEDFRLEWADLMAKADNSLTTAEQVAPLIERAKQFRSEVEGLVLQETKDWVTEFQSSMAQMEKDVAAQLSTLKAQVDKTIQAKEAASQLGAIQLTIVNPTKAATGSLKVTLLDSKNQSVQEGVQGASWAKINVAAGQYQLTVEATINGQPFSDQKVIIVEPGKTAPAQVTL